MFALLIAGGYDPEAVVFPATAGMGLVVTGVSLWCDQRSGRGRKGWGGWAFLRTLAVFVLLAATVFAVQIAMAPGLAPPGGRGGQSAVQDALVGGLLVVAGNVVLVSVIRNAGHSILRMGMAFVGICTMAMVFFGGQIVDLSVRALGLGLLPHVSVSLDADTAERARQAGFACVGPERATSAKGAAGCIISGFLVTRIGLDFVMMRNEEKIKNGNADSGPRETAALMLANYLVVPKASVMVVPANVTTGKKENRK